MKKLITKTLSMILMLAMALSMTAMAAYTPLKSDTDPNAYAFKNYIHRSYVWNTRVIEDGSCGHLATWASAQKGNDDWYDMDSKYKDLQNYESPYGNPTETWNYLNERYHTEVADTWARRLLNCFDFKHNGAEAANNYLEAITDLDNQFVYAYETYGEKAAIKFAKHFIYSAGDRYVIYNFNDTISTIKGVTLEEWLVDPGMAGGVYKPINMAPMSNDPAAMANIPVATKTTLQVNGVAKSTLIEPSGFPFVCKKITLKAEAFNGHPCVKGPNTFPPGSACATLPGGKVESSDFIRRRCSF